MSHMAHVQTFNFPDRNPRKKDKKVRTKMTRRKRRTKKSIKYSWFLLLIALDSHGRKMPLIHKVSGCNVKSVSFTMKHEGLDGQNMPFFFSQAELTQVIFSFVFIQIVNLSIKDLLVGQALCFSPSRNKTNTTILPRSHA